MEESKKEENLEEKKKERPRNKKIIVLLIGIIIVILAGIALFVMSQKNDKEKKAEEIFGNDYCDSVLHMATNDLAEHTCSICGEEFKASGMRANICDKCANLLDRCNFCGKKLTEEVKEQRNELLGE